MRLITRKLIVKLAAPMTLLTVGALYLTVRTLVLRPVQQLVRASGEIAQNQLPEFTAVARAIAAGDLTRRLEARIEPLTVSTADEIGEPTRAFNLLTGALNETGDDFRLMTDALRDSIGQINDGPARVAAASTQLAQVSSQSQASSAALADSTEQIITGIQEMAGSINLVAAHAQTQTTAAAETSASITRMAASMQTVTDHVRTLSECAAFAGKAAQDGRQTLNHAVSNLERLSATIENTGLTIGLATAPKALAALSRRLATLPIRPTCSCSTPPSKPPAPVNTAPASPSSRMKSESSRNSRPVRPAKSAI